MINIAFKRICKFSNQVPKKQIIFKLFPQKYHPYIKIGRYDKPIGFMLLYWPCAWGLSLINPVPPVFDYGLFLFGSMALRASGCIINDIADKQFDKQVQRTKNRPLAKNELTLKQAIAFLFCNLTGGLFVLPYLNMNGIISSFLILPIVCIYPLMKRYTNYPQAVLGICFNWGVIVAYLSRSQIIDPVTFIPIYLAGICWTLIYDTVYAFQDIKDDQRIGVKSTAITWKSNYKLVFNRLIFSSYFLMCYSMIQNGFAPLSGLLLGISHLIWRKKILDLNIQDPKQCGKLFRQSTYFGLAVTISLIIGNIYKLQLYNKKKQIKESN